LKLYICNIAEQAKKWFTNKGLSIKRIRDRTTSPTNLSIATNPLAAAQPKESAETQDGLLEGEVTPADANTLKPTSPQGLLISCPPFPSTLAVSEHSAHEEEDKSMRNGFSSSSESAEPSKELSDQVSYQCPQDTNETASPALIPEASGGAISPAGIRSDPVIEPFLPYSMFIRHSDYPNLTFYDLEDHAEIRSTSDEQFVNLINNLGLSIFIPPNALPQDQKTVRLSIIPVSGGRVEVPPNYELHTPLYMLTPCKLDREAVIKVTHTSLIEDEEDSSNMVVLVPDELAQSQTTGIYTLKEIDVERRFEVGSQTGEIFIKDLQSIQIAKRVTPTSEGQMPGKRLDGHGEFYKLVCCICQLKCLM